MTTTKRFAAFVLAMILVLVPLCSCSEKTETMSDDKIKENLSSLFDVILDEQDGGHKKKKKEPKDECVDKRTVAVSKYTPLMWRVEDGDGDEIYLFGTIHVGDDSFYPLPDYVTDAFESSDILAVEFDIEAFEQNITATQNLYLSALYEDGTIITDHIDGDLYERAEDILSENDSYISGLEYFKPILWSDMISTIVMEKSGYTGDNGIDRYLLNEAKKKGMNIAEVESAQFQIDMETGFSDGLQELLLLQSVEEYDAIDESCDNAKALVDAWYHGDEAALTEEDDDNIELYETDAEYRALCDEYNKAMLTDRNIGMADFCEEALENSESVFFCVGCAHFLGDDGIVKLLRDRGYTVEKIGS